MPVLIRVRDDAFVSPASVVCVRPSDIADLQSVVELTERSSVYSDLTVTALASKINACGNKIVRVEDGRVEFACGRELAEGDVAWTGDCAPGASVSAGEIIVNGVRYVPVADQ